MNNIEIRQITKNDTQNIIKWRNSSHIMNVFIDRTPLTEEIHNNWLENKVSKGEVCQFIACDLDNNVDFGSGYLRDIDLKNKKAEYGIFIGEEDYIGKGYGSIITKKVIDYGFDKIGLNKIYARVLAFNKPSYNMFLKLGFSQDAILRDDVIIDGQYTDVYIMSILKREWKL